MSVNYTVTSFEVEVSGSSPWGLQDIGSYTPDTSILSYNDYSWIPNSDPDAGVVPLRMTISPIDQSTYTVSAANFSMRGYSYNEVEQSLPINGFTWLAESLPEGALPEGVVKVTFTDTTIAGQVGNQVEVRAWLDASYMTPFVSQNITLDIDGDADLLETPPPQYMFLECPSIVNEGDTITYYLMYNNMPEAIPGTNTNFANDYITYFWYIDTDQSTVTGGDLDFEDEDSLCDPNLESGYAYTTGTSSGGAGVSEFTIGACIDGEIETQEQITVCLEPFDSYNIPTGGMCCTTYISSIEEYVYGCTDPSAQNYDPNATMNQVSDSDTTNPCIYEGCTDPNASNYNPFATIDDGSCEQSYSYGIRLRVDPDLGLEVFTPPVYTCGGSWQTPGTSSGATDSFNANINQDAGYYRYQGPNGEGCDTYYTLYGSSTDDPYCGSFVHPDLGESCCYSFHELGYLPGTTTDYGSTESMTSGGMVKYWNIGPSGPNNEWASFTVDVMGGNAYNIDQAAIGRFKQAFIIKPKPGFTLSRHNLRPEPGSIALTSERLNNTEGNSFQYNPGEDIVEGGVEEFAPFGQNQIEWFNYGTHTNAGYGSSASRDGNAIDTTACYCWRIDVDGTYLPAPDGGPCEEYNQYKPKSPYPLSSNDYSPWGAPLNHYEIHTKYLNVKYRFFDADDNQIGEDQEVPVNLGDANEDGCYDEDRGWDGLDKRVSTIPNADCVGGYGSFWENKVVRLHDSLFHYTGSPMTGDAMLDDCDSCLPVLIDNWGDLTDTTTLTNIQNLNSLQDFEMETAYGVGFELNTLSIGQNFGQTTNFGTASDWDGNFVFVRLDNILEDIIPASIPNLAYIEVRILGAAMPLDDSDEGTLEFNVSVSI